MKTIELEKSVLKLPASKRAKIASRLLESLDAESEHAHGKVWSEEADARVAAYESGRLDSKSADQVLGYRGKRRG